MPKFTVIETVTYDFFYEVEADTAEEARQFVEDGEEERQGEEPGETTYTVVEADDAAE